MHDKGVYTWNDGREYTRDYLDDKKHGHGVNKQVFFNFFNLIFREYKQKNLKKADGRIYEGE